MARGGRPFKVNAAAEKLAGLIQQKDNQAAREILLHLGIDAHDGYLRTAIHWAAFQGHLELLAWLIEQGANVNQQDKNGYTALHFAAQAKQLAAASLLLTSGADPNITDIHGNSALWTAIFNARGDWQLVKLYLQRGAGPAIANKYQCAPADFAASVAQCDLSTLL